MKFGKYINKNIPSSEVYLNERVYDELVKAGKFIWNKIKKVVKSVKGFIFPVNEKGQELEQFINIPANVVAMALPASIDYCPSDATIELAEEYDMEVMQTKTMDEALDDAIRRENKEITTYWTRVIKEYQKPKNESLTISDTVKLVNEKYYHRTVNTSNVLNEALNHSRVEESSNLNVPKLLEVTRIDNRWALVSEFIEGKTKFPCFPRVPCGKSIRKITKTDCSFFRHR